MAETDKIMCHLMGVMWVRQGINFNPDMDK